MTNYNILDKGLTGRASYGANEHGRDGHHNAANTRTDGQELCVAASLGRQNALEVYLPGDTSKHQQEGIVPPSTPFHRTIGCFSQPIILGYI